LPIAIALDTSEKRIRFKLNRRRLASVSVVEHPDLKGASMKRPLALIAFVGAAVAVIAAGCGSSSKNYSSSSKPTSQTTTQAASTSSALSLRSTSLGKVLVGPNGRTLYLFEKDTGGKSACTGSCAAAWPPLTTTGKPTAGSAVNAAMLSVTKRPDGKSQVVYAGHPLYYYSADMKAGDTTGQGVDAFGAEWYVVSATGSKVEKSSGSASGGSSQGGYHY
jgi:predicted lipoprotein with Yx(FWY)xxD motif